MGWTHFSKWGKFEAKKGQHITIKAVSANPDLHPGITVWSRSAEDTAPDNYVTDHFYVQNAPQYVLGAKDESTGAELGDIIMRVADYGYDLDNNVRIRGLDGVKDGVPGQLILNFRARKTATYVFVVGGVNPEPGAADPKALYDVVTEVMVQP
jgi:hypothetical protein